MTTMSRAEAKLTQAEGGGRIAVIAGGGALPVAVARTLQQRGDAPFVVIVSEETEDEDTFRDLDRIILSVEQIGLLLPALRKAGVDRLIMAGNVTRRPNLRRIKWTVPVVLALPRLAAGLLRGDDGLLRAVVELLETNGIRVVGPHEIVPDLLAPAGILTRAGPTAQDKRDIAAASEAALAIGRLDIGQAAVAIGGRAVALEDIEGTDGLLRRTADLRSHGRLAGKKRGVLAKRRKPLQEKRVDLPAIGPDTIVAAQAAGLAGVAVDAGNSFILDFDSTVARADELGLFIIGLEPGEEAQR